MWDTLGDVEIAVLGARFGVQKMADVFFKLTSEEKDAVNALLKVLDAQKKVEGGYKAIRERSKEADDAATKLGKSLDAGVKSAASTGVSMTGIATAAGLAATAVGVVTAEMERASKQADATKESIIGMHEALTGQQQIHIAPKINQAIRQIAGTTDEVSQHQVRELETNLLREHGKKLSTNQIVETLDYAVRAKAAGLDANLMAHNRAVYAELDPTASAATIDKRAGRFAGLTEGKVRLGPDDVKQYREAREAGVSNDDANLMLLAAHKSDESAKVIGRIRDEAGKTITAEELKDKYQMRPEHEAKVKNLEQQRDALTEREHELDRLAGTSHSKLHAQRGERNKIKLQHEDLGDEIERYKKDQVIVNGDETARLRRLDKIPIAQRQFEMLKDVSLMPHDLRTHGELYAADMRSIKANRPNDLLEYTNDANARNYRTQEGMEYRAAKDLEKEQVKKKEIADGTYEEKGALNEKVAKIKQEQAVVKANNDAGGGWAGATVEWVKRLYNYGKTNVDGFDRQPAPQAPHDDGPKEVIIKADQSQPNRIVVRPNGGEN